MHASERKSMRLCASISSQLSNILIWVLSRHSGHPVRRTPCIHGHFFLIAQRGVAYLDFLFSNYFQYEIRRYFSFSSNSLDASHPKIECGSHDDCDKGKSNRTCSKCLHFFTHVKETRREIVLSCAWDQRLRLRMIIIKEKSFWFELSHCQPLGVLLCGIDGSFARMTRTHGPNHWLTFARQLTKCPWGVVGFFRFCWFTRFLFHHTVYNGVTECSCGYTDPHNPNKKRNCDVKLIMRWYRSKRAAHGVFVYEWLVIIQIVRGNG